MVYLARELGLSIVIPKAEREVGWSSSLVEERGEEQAEDVAEEVEEEPREIARGPREIARGPRRESRLRGR